MDKEKIIEKSIGIQLGLAKLKCTNADCNKKETSVDKMYNVTIKGEEILDDIRFTEKICCDNFKKIIEEQYNYLRMHLVVT